MNIFNLNKASVVVLVIVAVIVLTAIVGGVYLIVNKETEKGEQTEEEESLPEDEVANLPSEDLSKEGWKTYRNEEYGWEVKYPGEWASQEPQGFSGSLVLDAVNFNKSDIKDIEIRTDNITIKVISKESIEELIPIWFSRVEKERDEKKKLNEINWHLVYYKEGVYKKGISALTEYAGKIYKIGFSSPNEANFLEKSNIFNQILSTFKFLL